jgi:hypothetical protein
MCQGGFSAIILSTAVVVKRDWALEVVVAEALAVVCFAPVMPPLQVAATGGWQDWWCELLGCMSKASLERSTRGRESPARVLPLLRETQIQPAGSVLHTCWCLEWDEAVCLRGWVGVMHL